MTISEQGRERVEEVKKILQKYDIKEEDLNQILVMFQWVFFQWHQAATSGRTLERIIKENTRLSDKKLFALYGKKIYEEEQKFPFDCEELESEEK